MASSVSTPGGGPGNPIVDVEATHVTVLPDHGLNAVSLEVTDQSGDGFRTFFELRQAMDVAIHLAVAVARLRRLPGTVP